MEWVCIDFLSLEPANENVENILFVTDNFTKYAQTFPTRNQTVKTTAKVLFVNLFLHHGFFLEILSNQSRDFDSSTIKALCEVAHIKKTRTTPYYPMGNSLTIVR